MLELITVLLLISILIFVYYYRKGYKDKTRLIKERKTKKRNLAFQKEKALNYVEAAKIWEELGEIKEAARVRTLKAEQNSVKVMQKVIHGDEVTKTEIKDSVLNRHDLCCQ